MIPLIGTFGTTLVIIALFRMNRGAFKVTNAVWAPYIWLLIASSRPLSNWLSLSEPVGQASAYIDGSPLDRNVLTALMAIGLYFLSKRQKQALSILSKNSLILVYFAYCLISVVWCDYPQVLLKRWIRSLGDIVMILIIITEPHWVDALKWLFTRISFILVPASILLIRFYPSLGRFYSRGGVPEWSGVGTDKNALGMICMLYGAGLLWYGINLYKIRKRTKGQKRELWAIAIVFTMILYLLFVVNSQTALACFLMSDVLVIMTAFRTFRKPVMATLVIVSMIGICYSVLFLGIGSGALTAMGRDASLTGRTEVWKTVIPYATNVWVGAGYENFWVGERMELFVRLLGGLNQAHNGYIEIYLNLGWVGLTLLGGIVFGGYWKVLKLVRNNVDTAGLRLAFIFICIVYNFTEASFKMQSPVWMFFLWSIMGASYVANNAAARKKSLAPVRPDFLNVSTPAPLGAPIS
ncbi:MAG TPA: O-antigen ligase family protein [Terriglobales bacterium]|nr:O-antigen ligase family protein [Terriglobales bacterium]